MRAVAFESEFVSDTYSTDVMTAVCKYVITANKHGGSLINDVEITKASDDLTIALMEWFDTLPPEMVLNDDQSTSVVPMDDYKDMVMDDIDSTILPFVATNMEINTSTDDIDSLVSVGNSTLVFVYNN